jgi:hypothetical protein
VLDQVVANLVLVPGRRGQQVLQAVRGGLAGALSDRPAVLAWQVSQQPQHQGPGVPQRLEPAKPASNASSPACHRPTSTLWPAATL